MSTSTLSGSGRTLEMGADTSSILGFGLSVRALETGRRGGARALGCGADVVSADSPPAGLVRQQHGLDGEGRIAELRQEEGRDVLAFRRAAHARRKIGALELPHHDPA